MTQELQIANRLIEMSEAMRKLFPNTYDEKSREVYDNNNDVVCGIYCIVGYVCALVCMPSLQVAMFVFGLTCGLDNIGWLVVYHKNRDRFRELDNE